MEKADYFQTMKAYAEVQKTYTQYAVALLVLPLTFLKDIVGLPKEVAIIPYVNVWLWSGWLSLLICIAASLIYQIVSAKLIAQYSSGSPFMKYFPRVWFSTSAVSFFAGIVLLAVGLITAPPYKPPLEQSNSNASAPK